MCQYCDTMCLTKFSPGNTFYSLNEIANIKFEASIYTGIVHREDAWQISRVLPERNNPMTKNNYFDETLVEMFSKDDSPQTWSMQGC